MSQAGGEEAGVPAILSRATVSHSPRSFSHLHHQKMVHIGMVLVMMITVVMTMMMMVMRVKIGADMCLNMVVCDKKILHCI